MRFQEIKSRLEKELSKEEKYLDNLAQEIHRHPELSFQEDFACELLTEYLEKQGFKVEKGIAGLKTSFRAYSRNQSRRPCVGFLAEMDALRGLGHACGHNLIGVSSVGAGVILRKAFPGLKGGIEVIGCPAEEQGGGKVIMEKAGIFDGLDLAILVHPSNRTEIYKLSLALVEVELEFIGRASHASANPEQGINALDSAIETFNIVNALRSKLGGYARISGIIREGGKAPNIIPDRAKVEFWVREENLEKALSLVRMVKRAGESSARAIGAKCRAKIHQELGYESFLPNRTAGKVLWEIFQGLRIKIEQEDEKKGMGSTDLGNLSWRAPALHPTIKIGEAIPHSEEFAQASGSEKGLKQMKKALLAMTILGYRVMTDRRLRIRMWKELAEAKKSR